MTKDFISVWQNLTNIYQKKTHVIILEQGCEMELRAWVSLYKKLKSSDATNQTKKRKREKN